MADTKGKSTPNPTPSWASTSGFYKSSPFKKRNPFGGRQMVMKQSSPRGRVGVQVSNDDRDGKRRQTLTSHREEPREASRVGNLSKDRFQPRQHRDERVFARDGGSHQHVASSPDLHGSTFSDGSDCHGPRRHSATAETNTNVTANKSDASTRHASGANKSKDLEDQNGDRAKTRREADLCGATSGGDGRPQVPGLFQFHQSSPGKYRIVFTHTSRGPCDRCPESPAERDSLACGDGCGVEELKCGTADLPRTARPHGRKFSIYKEKHEAEDGQEENATYTIHVTSQVLGDVTTNQNASCTEIPNAPRKRETRGQLLRQALLRKKGECDNKEEIEREKFAVQHNTGNQTPDDRSSIPETKRVFARVASSSPPKRRKHEVFDSKPSRQGIQGRSRGSGDREGRGGTKRPPLRLIDHLEKIEKSHACLVGTRVSKEVGRSESEAPRERRSWTGQFPEHAGIAVNKADTGVDAVFRENKRVSSPEMCLKGDPSHMHDLDPVIAPEVREVSRCGHESRKDSCPHSKFTGVDEANSITNMKSREAEGKTSKVTYLHVVNSPEMLGRDMKAKTTSSRAGTREVACQYSPPPGATRHPYPCCACHCHMTGRESSVTSGQLSHSDRTEETNDLSRSKKANEIAYFTPANHVTKSLPPIVVETPTVNYCAFDRQRDVAGVNSSLDLVEPRETHLSCLDDESNSQNFVLLKYAGDDTQNEDDDDDDDGDDDDEVDDDGNDNDVQYDDRTEKEDVEPEDDDDDHEDNNDDDNNDEDEEDDTSAGTDETTSKSSTSTVVHSPCAGQADVTTCRNNSASRRPPPVVGGVRNRKSTPGAAVDTFRALVEQTKRRSRVGGVRMLRRNRNQSFNPNLVTVNPKSPPIDENSGHRFIGDYLLKLWKRQVLCDVKVNVNHSHFLAHKLVLAAFSDVFTPTTPYPPPTLEFTVPNSNPEAVFRVFNYIYTSSMDVDDEKLEDILHVAIVLGIHEVKDIIMEILSKPSIDNVEMYIDIQNRCGIPVGILDYPEIYRNHLNQMLKMEKFLELSSEEVESILRDPGVMVETEVDTLHALATWAQFRPLERLPEVPRLLDFIIFEVISPESIAGIVELYDPIFSDIGARNKISEVFRFHALLLAEEKNPSGKPDTPPRHSVTRYPATASFASGRATHLHQLYGAQTGLRSAASQSLVSGKGGRERATNYYSVRPRYPTNAHWEGEGPFSPGAGGGTRKSRGSKLGGGSIGRASFNFNAKVPATREFLRTGGGISGKGAARRSRSKVTRTTKRAGTPSPSTAKVKAKNQSKNNSAASGDIQHGDVGHVKLREKEEADVHSREGRAGLTHEDVAVAVSTADVIGVRRRETRRNLWRQCTTHRSERWARDFRETPPLQASKDALVRSKNFKAAPNNNSCCSNGTCPHRLAIQARRGHCECSPTSLCSNPDRNSRRADTEEVTMSRFQRPCNLMSEDTYDKNSNASGLFDLV